MVPHMIMIDFFVNKIAQHKQLSDFWTSWQIVSSVIVAACRNGFVFFTSSLNDVTKAIVSDASLCNAFVSLVSSSRAYLNVND